MSHFTQIKLALKDKQALIETLQTIFGEESVEFHKNPQSLVGYVGDTRIQEAHIIVRREHLTQSSNDLGFLETPDGYIMWLSEFDARVLPRTFPEFKHFQQLYASKVVENTAKRMGAKVSSEKLPDGSIRYTLKPQKTVVRR